MWRGRGSGGQVREVRRPSPMAHAPVSRLSYRGVGLLPGKWSGSDAVLRQSAEGVGIRSDRPTQGGSRTDPIGELLPLSRKLAEVTASSGALSHSASGQSKSAETWQRPPSAPEHSSTSPTGRLPYCHRPRTDTVILLPTTPDNIGCETLAEHQVPRRTCFEGGVSNDGRRWIQH